MSDSVGGRVITFYSYKGGTGRSMALAHVAWILASSGKKVLAIDWDLEAPGLHRFFGAFLPDKELKFSEGVIDFVVNYSAAALDTAAPANTGLDRDAWLKTVRDLHGGNAGRPRYLLCYEHSKHRRRCQCRDIRLPGAAEEA